MDHCSLKLIRGFYLTDVDVPSFAVADVASLCPFAGPHKRARNTSSQIRAAKWFCCDLHFLFHFFGPKLKTWGKTISIHLALTNQRNGKEIYIILVQRQNIKFFLLLFFEIFFNSIWNTKSVQLCMIKATFFLLNQHFVYKIYKDPTLEGKF